MFQSFIKNFLLSTVVLQLIFGQTIAYAANPDIGAQEQTINQINEFMKTSEPSDIPFVDYMEKFVFDHTQPLKRFNLSSFQGKQVYIGYGVYDQDQKYCKYIEQPGLDPNGQASDRVDTYFTNISSFNQHQYAISIDPMSFSECMNKVNKFGGYMASPTSVAESGFLGSKFGGDKWLGVERGSCTTDYVNQEGSSQKYFDWSMSQDEACLPGQLQVKQNAYGKWVQQTGNETNYCVLETDSEDITRPVKVCAPWWRIERDYKNETEVEYSGINIYRINQADIPQQFNICVRHAAEAIADAEEKPRREVSCTTYYDATSAPECLKDPLQPICFVDECEGYVKNACTHKEELTPFKDYTKVQAMVNGTMTWIRGKDMIRTQIYDCPPSPPSADTCLEKSQVVIYPKECPGSQCHALKQCIYGAVNQDVKNQCYLDYNCNKIYGSPDSPVFNGGGELIELLGICEDGTVLHFPANVQNRNERVCLEYSEYTITERINQNCTLERPYTDHVVHMSLTGVDIYEDDPMCVRTNNLFEARPIQELTLNYATAGFARTVIKKSYINGTEQLMVNHGSGSYVRSPNEVFPVEDSVDFTVTVTATSIDCSDITGTWAAAQGARLNSGVLNIKSSAQDPLIPAGQMQMEYIGLSEDACEERDNQFGNGTHIYEENNSTGEHSCKVFYPKSQEDAKFQLIQGIGSEEQPTDFLSEYPISTQECNRYAQCIGAAYNEDELAGGNGYCKLKAGEEYAAPTAEPTLPPGPDPERCYPPAGAGAAATEFDGNEDVFSIQEVVDGQFGYYSNHTTWPYVNNVVTYQGLELLPIKKVPTIKDALVYEGIFKQVSILTKKPAILLGAVSGAVSGFVASPAILGLVTTTFGIGMVVVVVFVLVALIFGPKKKYNEQWNYWSVYKYVPKERYIINIYNYDYRILVTDKFNNAKVYQTAQNEENFKLLYMQYGEDPRENGGHTDELTSFTGTLEPEDFKIMINNWFKQKQQLFMCFGWAKESVPQDPFETGIHVKYPKCKWYNWTCDKRKEQTHSPYIDPYFKTMANTYQGAVNTAVIFVPYIGDYEVKAFDGGGGLLGVVTVYESEFLASAADKAANAQVMFGLNMNIAVPEGTVDKACRYELMAEWGGGVSGIYYENDDTGLYEGCSKSSDPYVSSHSARMLTVRSLDENKEFKIYLERPMPWANRTFLVTLGEKEIRKYRCYEDFGECADADFTTEGEQ